MSARFRMNEGDWVCSETQCANVNFARRTSCNRCGKEKTESSKKKKLGTEIGKAAAEKSHGLFSADDWQCSKCGNVNWARRQQCNTCNAPKYGEVEERTGYGGGYNERENVEYIEREESDGEYDEYGRKKKQYRGRGESSSSSDKTTPDAGNSSKDKPDLPKAEVKKIFVDTKKVETEEDEEEDDDDDDADLSKYDLSGWGDSNDSATGGGDKSEKDKDKEKRKSSSPSSSSSSSSSSSRSRSRSPPSKKRKYDSDSRSRSRSSSSDSRSVDT